MAKMSNWKSFIPGFASHFGLSGYVLLMIPIKKESTALYFFDFLVVNSFLVSHDQLFHLKDCSKRWYQMNWLLAINPVPCRIVILITITVLGWDEVGMCSPSVANTRIIVCSVYIAPWRVIRGYALTTHTNAKHTVKAESWSDRTTTALGIDVSGTDTFNSNTYQISLWGHVTS